MPQYYVASIATVANTSAERAFTTECDVATISLAREVMRCAIGD